ncbi:5-dehydro-4-deoxyglucarate dehydratase [Microbacterium sp. SSM24]|uniref:5-dehydro-4-deoxyglucarate dehydratase n=1 Tax=Microbacterium sp. SSM24 TaxID=2991714 RepID=UPI0022260921|nr:5-dehydro-4-deoxyglucarate dehydratase [Microbacterium sp. SSM24]MCW3492588.1 5-dehydro-4-deoxyglucarate dehydratase [Microbacterium sp. SSM24]
MGLTFDDGPLYFPITVFGASGGVDLATTASLIEERMAQGAGGVFPACGTGEFAALAPDEAIAVVAATVHTVGGRLPVVAGVGGAVGTAVRSAKAVQDAGADGILLLPPYLSSGPQEGLRRYVEAVAAVTTLPVIVYHRANARFSPATFSGLLADLPNVVGLKDGIGDVALAAELALAARAVRPNVLLFNGLLTAEASQLAYAGIGIPLYSSAVFAMAPGVARAFHRALARGDAQTCDKLLREFFYPLVALRDSTPGYAVSLIKAGIALSEPRAGLPRPPLVEPSAVDLERLAALLRTAAELTAQP